MKGVEGGFAQAGHGKKTSLEKLEKEDWVIYYSSKDQYGNGKPCQKFTAIGRVNDEKPYQAEVSMDFKPWRRDVDFYPCVEVEIRPLLDDLGFITNRRRWGLHLMSGFVKIGKSDFELIRKRMIEGGCGKGE